MAEKYAPPPEGSGDDEEGQDSGQQKPAGDTPELADLLNKPYPTLEETVAWGKAETGPHLEPLAGTGEETAEDATYDYLPLDKSLRGLPEEHEIAQQGLLSSCSEALEGIMDDAPPISEQHPSRVPLTDFLSALSFADLFAVYGVLGSSEIEKRMDRAIAGGEYISALRSWLEYRRAVQMEWEESESGLAYTLWKERWEKKRESPNNTEAATIIRPLLQVVLSTSRTVEDVGESLAKGWIFEGSNPEDLNLLIAQAPTSPFAWDAAFQIYEWLEIPSDNHAGEIPVNLLKLRNDSLEEKIRRPSLKVGRPTEFFRSFAIQKIVQELVGFGKKATRNDESSHRQSACDAVAQASERQLDFDNVKKIWLNFRGRKSIDTFRKICLSETPGDLSNEFDMSVPHNSAFFSARYFLLAGGRSSPDSV